MSRKSIIITGASSQLARGFLPLSKKYDLVFLKKKHLDISNYSNCKKIIKKLNPLIIINTAAYTNVNQSEIDYKKAFKINYESVKNISKICKIYNIFLIHFSTDYVFFGRSNSSYNENSKCQPKNKYGLSKLLADNFIKKNMDKYIIIRLSWLIGYGKTNFVYKILNNLKKTKYSLKVVANEFGSPTFVDDVINLCDKIIFDIIHNHKIQSGIYHFNSSNKKISRYQFARKIISIYSKMKNINISCDPIYVKSIIRPNNSFLDTTKVNKFYNLKLNPINNSLHKMIKYYNTIL